jgi:hypothetical protein
MDQLSWRFLSSRIRSRCAGRWIGRIKNLKRVCSLRSVSGWRPCSLQSEDKARRWVNAVDNVRSQVFQRSLHHGRGSASKRMATMAAIDLWAMTPDGKLIGGNQTCDGGRRAGPHGGMHGAGGWCRSEEFRGNAQGSINITRRCSREWRRWSMSHPGCAVPRRPSVLKKSSRRSWREFVCTGGSRLLRRGSMFTVSRPCCLHKV